MVPELLARFLRGEFRRASRCDSPPVRAGNSLHPLAQTHLSAFFDGLAETNKLLDTSDSPFLVDADRLGRASKVYVSTDGTSNITADLRASDGDITQRCSG